MHKTLLDNSFGNQWPKLAIVLGLIIIVMLTFFAASNFLQPSRPRSEVNFYATIEDCTRGAVELLKPEKINSEILNYTLNYCYTRNFFQASLNEAHVRIGIYERQSSQNQVMLWMVVAITVSGAGLSALQLIASYKLAVIGRETMATLGELTLERDKLAVKSSMTGLLILSVSLAFFIVYVLFVYTIRENTHTGVQATADQVVETLPDRPIRRTPEDGRGDRSGTGTNSGAPRPAEGAPSASDVPPPVPLPSQ